MTSKVWWLMLWMTLAFWAGCAADAENQNYRINDEPVPMLEEDYPTQSVLPSGPAVPAGSVAVTAVTREDWPTLRIGSERGIVLHHPHYWTYDELRQRPQRPSPLMVGPSEMPVDSLQIAAATSEGREAVTLNDLADLALAPLKAMFDTGAWPVKAVLNPPWAFEQTPEH